MVLKFLGRFRGMKILQIGLIKERGSSKPMNDSIHLKLKDIHCQIWEGVWGKGLILPLDYQFYPHTSRGSVFPCSLDFH